jgi:hypothetical protein
VDLILLRRVSYLDKVLIELIEYFDIIVTKISDKLEVYTGQVEVFVLMTRKFD